MGEFAELVFLLGDLFVAAADEENAGCVAVGVLVLAGVVGVIVLVYLLGRGWRRRLLR